MKFLKRLPGWLLITASVMFVLSLAILSHTLLSVADDLYYYFYVVELFGRQGNLIGITDLRYQPGANLWFGFIALLANWSSLNTFPQFAALFIILNYGLLLGLERIYRFYHSVGDSFRSLQIYLAITIVIAGPIILFRLEVLTVLPVALALLSWKKKQIFLALFFLGVGASVKVYPIVLVPCFLLPWVFYRDYKSIIWGSLACLAGILLPSAVFFLVAKVPLEVFIYNLTYLVDRGVQIESSLATVNYLLSLLINFRLPNVIHAFGTWQIATSQLLLPMWLVNNFWVVLVAGFYLWLFFEFRHRQFYPLVRIVIGLLMVLLLGSKVFSPQYLLWWLLLLPLVWQQIPRRQLILIVTVGLLTQALYPPIYSFSAADLLVNNRLSGPLFWTVLFRNLLLGLTCYSWLKSLKINTAPEIKINRRHSKNQHLKVQR